MNLPVFFFKCVNNYILTIHIADNFVDNLLYNLRKFAILGARVYKCTIEHLKCKFDVKFLASCL